LSYTTFRYSRLKTSSTRVANDGTLQVSVDVTNTGSYAGDEVVQLYVKHPHSKVDRPAEELRGFQRVTLEPNQTKTVEIPLKASALAYWDEKLAAFKVEAEQVDLLIGSSSSDIKLTATVRIQ
jgi:beta-glucosidase